MTERRLEDMSKEELIRELKKLQTAERRLTADSATKDREHLIHDLHVHQVQLEMQNRELRETQHRLEDTSSRYSDLYDFAPVGYCTLDRSGCITEINLAGAALLGATRDTLVGRPFSIVAPLVDSRVFYSHLQRCLEEQARVTTELTFSIDEHRTRIVQMVSEPVIDRDSGTRIHRTILVDISELKALEDRLRLLADAGQRLAASLDLAALADAASRIVVPALADLCMLDVLSPSGAIERKVVRFADPNQQMKRAEQLMRFTPPAGRQAPQARVIASGEPVLLAEVPSDDAAGVRAVEIRSLMIVPLSARGGTFGALTLASAESNRRYSSLELEVAQDLARRVATAMENASLYTESQSIAEKLRLSEARSSGIVSISADAIISIDENQRITAFNEGAEKIFGYPANEVLGAPLEILIPDRFRGVHREHVERFAAGGEPARKMGKPGAPIFGQRKNGEVFPADAAISRLEVAGRRVLTVALRDVTERARNESDHRFLSEVGPVLAATLDYRETLAKITELAVRHLADFCLVDLMDEKGEFHRVEVACRDPSGEHACDALRRVKIDRSRPHLIRPALVTGQSVLISIVTPEMMAMWGEGQSEAYRRMLVELHPRSIIAVPLKARGKLLGALGLFSTSHQAYGPADLRLAEELAYRAALSIENAKLYQVAAQAILARDEMLSVVAHDLRNPLGSILMQAALLRPRKGQPERRSRKPAEVIERAAGRMNHLIHDLLDVARMEAGSLSMERMRVPVTRLVTEFVEMQKPLAAAASLELQLQLAPNLGEVFADRDRLLQVLENLITNAVKFTRPGGRITIEADRRRGEVLFRVADTGEGMDAEELTHVFDRFWQGRKASRAGVGLGLPITKGIVEAHGGRIWVESQVGIGTSFFFTMPAPPRGAPKLPGPARTVLVVEDDPADREALCKTVESGGFDAASASNGAEALDYLYRGPRPFLVILDLTMPVMDGWAFLEVKNGDRELSSIPVIVVSGQDNIEEKVAAAHASFVQKPIELDRLIETIEYAVH